MSESKTLCIVKLDQAWTECPLCGKEIPLVRGGFCLPMYEGRVDWDSKVYFPVCPDCYYRVTL